jgi:hypothetical protein
MGNLVNLILRGSDLPFLAEEDEESTVWLSATNGLPLFWLSLIGERDLRGEWEREVRACYADPDECGDGLPAIRVSWTSAQDMLAQAIARADQQVPTLSTLFLEWATALGTVARGGPTQEVQLDLGSYANFFDDVDSFFGELRRGVQIWHGDGVVVLPTVNSVENDLTGMDIQTGVPFPRALPEWRAGRLPPGHDAPAQPAPSGWVNLQDWGLALLCAVTVLGAAVLGDWFYGTVGQSIGFVVGLTLFVGLFWRWVKAR